MTCYKCVCVAAVSWGLPPLALTCLGVVQRSPQEQGDQEQRLQWRHGAGSPGEGLCVPVPLLGETRMTAKCEGDLFNLFGSLPRLLSPPYNPHILP